MDKFAELIQQLAEKFGPHAIESALNAARVEAMRGLIAGVICLILLVPAILAFKWGVTHLKAFNANDDDFIGGVVTIAAAVIGMVLLVGTMVNLFDPWNYVTLFHPDWYLAKKVVLENLGK